MALDYRGRQSRGPIRNSAQLELFATTADDAAAEELEARDDEREERHGRPHLEALADPPAADGRGAGEERSFGAGDPGSAGTDRGSAVRTDHGAEDGVSRGLGAGDTGMGFSRERGGDGPALVAREKSP